MLFRQALGHVIRTARTEQGRSLRAVATEAGMSIGYLSEVERGFKEASSELLTAVASALDMAVSALIWRAGELMVAADSSVAVLAVAHDDRERPVSAA